MQSVTSTSSHSLYSQLRESITTHAFLAAIGAEVWRRGHFDAEILRAEFDAGGHDLVITANGVTRHIQLKSMRVSGRSGSWSTSQRLADLPSGCIVVLHIDDTDLRIRRFGLFAGPPGDPLPDISNYRETKHSKGDSTGNKSVRQGRWDVPRSKFEIYEHVADLYDALFVPELLDRG